MSQQRSDGSGQTSQSWVSQVSALYCNTYTSSFCKLFCILFMATQSTLRLGNLFSTEWFSDSFLLWKRLIHNSFWNTHFRDQKLCSQQKKCEGKISYKTMFLMKKKEKETSETLLYQNLTNSWKNSFVYSA